MSFFFPGFCPIPSCLICNNNNTPINPITEDKFCWFCHLAGTTEESYTSHNATDYMVRKPDNEHFGSSGAEQFFTFRENFPVPDLSLATAQSAEGVDTLVILTSSLTISNNYEVGMLNVFHFFSICPVILTELKLPILWPPPL